jgi:hypothetical protein
MGEQQGTFGVSARTRRGAMRSKTRQYVNTEHGYGTIRFGSLDWCGCLVL